MPLTNAAIRSIKRADKRTISKFKEVQKRLETPRILAFFRLWLPSLEFATRPS